MRHAALVLVLALATAQPACSDEPAPGGARIDAIATTGHGKVRLVTVATGLEHPWGMAFLPDGRLLVTERPGRLRIVAADGTLGAPLEGVPAVAATGQGGLLDVALGGPRS